jgi:hypothetical protein
LEQSQESEIRSQATVDSILAECVANEATFTYATPTLDLLGGGNAAPSATGLIDKAVLQTAGWIVQTA